MNIKSTSSWTLIYSSPNMFGGTRTYIDHFMCWFAAHSSYSLCAYCPGIVPSSVTVRYFSFYSHHTLFISIHLFFRYKLVLVVLEKLILCITSMIEFHCNLFTDPEMKIGKGRLFFNCMFIHCNLKLGGKPQFIGCKFFGCSISGCAIGEYVSFFGSRFKDCKLVNLKIENGATWCQISEGTEAYRKELERRGLFLNRVAVNVVE